MSRYIVLGIVLGGLLLGGCSIFDKVLPDKQQEYKKSQSLPDLEVPPDLTSESINDTMAVPEIDASGTATYSTYQDRVRRKAQERAESEPQEVQLLDAGEGKTFLILPEGFASAWESLGSALDKAGLELEDKDRARGVYSVRYSGGKGRSASKKEKGFFSRLAFWKDDSTYYLLSLTGVGDKTEIVILDQKGNWDSSTEAKEILNRIQSALSNQVGAKRNSGSDQAYPRL